MPPLNAAAWAQALTMYEQRYTFLLVGPRTEEEWVGDVAAIMRRETGDPRSWKAIDVDSDEEERGEDPYFPFAPLPTSRQGRLSWRCQLKPIPRPSAERLLVLLSTTWLDIPSARRDHAFDEHRPILESQAQTILSRFPEDTLIFTNTGYEGDFPDFYQPVRGCWPISRYEWDLALIAVSETEVGIVCSFDAS
ncbi:hypothetical protein ACGFW5_07465 [Streptomyces sp. NPDC048416]|uniref:hypothetical protein n=1 Tax=Streptomyces sp. NPDC048416 TaxID=3365546 RepID=UPI00370FF339